MRVLLCHVDVDDSEKPLLDMNKMAVLNDFTLVLAWSVQVTAFLEAYIGKSPRATLTSMSIARSRKCLGFRKSAMHFLGLTGWYLKRKVG